MTGKRLIPGTGSGVQTVSNHRRNQSQGEIAGMLAAAAHGESQAFAREIRIYFEVKTANDDRANSMIVFQRIPKTAGPAFRFLPENTFGLSASGADLARQAAPWHHLACQ
jgi:hypothetical protein